MVEFRGLLHANTLKEELQAVKLFSYGEALAPGQQGTPLLILPVIWPLFFQCPLWDKEYGELML